MTKVVSIKFRNGSRAYYFDPNGYKLDEDMSVVVETANGLEFGTVYKATHEVPDESIVSPFKKVIRLATKKDIQNIEDNKKKEEIALKTCEQMSVQFKLDMKLVRTEYSFDGNKVTFFFTSDGRVDFRDLVKALASKFHTRIELRQIGVRDVAKMLGGIGICGQPYCCKRFLDDFQPVSIKMAKDQGLSLNPTKISGSCGRLMCCLKYEQDAYEYLTSFSPSVGDIVEGEEGKGFVTDINLISGNIFVKPESGEGIPYKTHRDKVKIVSKGRRKSKNNNNQTEKK